MLHDLPFEGTMKVRNKGVDVTILADAETVDLAMTTTRSLVVCGISTAVLEVTCLDPVDERTLEYYEDTTKALLAMNTELYDAVSSVMKDRKKLFLFKGNGQKELFKTVKSL